MHRTCLNLLTLTIVDVFAGFGFQCTQLSQSGWPSGLRRCVQVAVSIGGVGSNPTSDSFLSSILGPDMHGNGGPLS